MDCRLVLHVCSIAGAGRSVTLSVSHVVTSLIIKAWDATSKAVINVLEYRLGRLIGFAASDCIYGRSFE
jgi:hypothetical protein